MQLHLNKRFEWKELPDMQFFRSEIDRQAKDITIGETLFFKEHGVKTEGEYKKKAMAEGFITKHSHIGWNSWDETARNLEYIYEELTRRGSYMSRMGLICDWVMGVPREYRDRLIPGTGLILNTPEAIAAALISMNDMVKPACKVLNTVADPVEILAEKLGTAVREGDGWRITNKAVVRLI